MDVVVRSNNNPVNDMTTPVSGLINDLDNERDTKLMQKDMDLLQQWEIKWTNEFQPAECEIIYITRKRRPLQFSYFLHEQRIKRVDHTNYLDIIISSDHRWHKHINYISTRANNTRYFLRRNINIKDTNIKQHAYKSWL